MKHWPKPPADLVLGAEEVHVWRIDLDAVDLLRSPCRLWLSHDERERAARRPRERDRLRWIAGRVSLRGILAGYLRCDPGEIRFLYGGNGKPMLAADADPEGLQFNLTHSGAIALVAVARDRAVGVDVETVRAVKNAAALAARVFSPAEQAALQSIPEAERLEAFFACWTRKEAWLKARGAGIFQAPQRFHVSVSPGDARPLLAVPGQPREAHRWSLHTLWPGEPWAAALAVEGRTETPQQWQWVFPVGEC